MLDIDAETLIAAVAYIGQSDDTLAVTCDVSAPDQVAASVAAIDAKFGRIDALVNNAAIADFRTCSVIQNSPRYTYVEKIS
ncbi:MAG: SDR family NAD(P)-dependent oxidoreductase [Paracoccaceae bacterium]